jgi:shikimate dehydrogenase
VLHATPLGLEGAVPDVTPRIIGPGTFAYDLGYGIPDTPFVRWAMQHGARAAAQGIGMLVEQAAEAFFVWRNVRPDTAPVHRALAGSTAQSTI